MAMTAIKLWQVSAGQGIRPLELADMSSLDAISRQLPGGYYSTFRTFGGRTRAIGLRAHLERLYVPATAAGIRPSVDVIPLRQTLAEQLSLFDAGEARVRLMLTIEKDAGQVYVALEPLKLLPESVYRDGVSVETAVQVQRDHPRLKSTAFIAASAQERQHIAESGIFEGLLVRSGRILEGMTSNFFYIREGTLGTARRGILLGVTRTLVLRAARGQGVRVLYRPLKVGELDTLQESFITSSSRGIVPVVQIDDRAVGQGVPGPLTQQLMRAYDALALKCAESIWK